MQDSDLTRHGFTYFLTLGGARRTKDFSSVDTCIDQQLRNRANQEQATVMTSTDWEVDAVVVASGEAPLDDSNVPLADCEFIATAADDNVRVPSSATPGTLHQSNVPSETTGTEALLAAAIQNTLRIGQETQQASSPGTSGEQLEPVPVSSSPNVRDTAAHKKSDPVSTSHPTDPVKAAPNDQEQPHDIPKAKEKDAPPAPQQKPSYWKLAGRAIKKHKAGKIVLHGLKDGYEGTKNTVGAGYESTKKTLGIGVGRICIQVHEAKVYRPEDVVQGTVQMELTESIAAARLVIALKGVRKSAVRVSSTSSGSQRQVSSNSGGTRKDTVHSFAYEIGGAQDYPCQGDFPFQVVIPRLQRKMSADTRSTLVGGLISSVQSIGAAMQNPIEWTLTATLHIPGRLTNMSKTMPIHVADDDY